MILFDPNLVRTFFTNNFFDLSYSTQSIIVTTVIAKLDLLTNYTYRQYL